jgi:hypothetical protein
MTKDAWEKEHKYRKSEHTCTWCKHSTLHQKDPWTNTYTCEEKQKARAGSSTKASSDCDLWEHE